MIKSLGVSRLIKIAICDDVKELIDNLNKILQKIAIKSNETIMVDGYCEPEKLVDALKNNERYDMIFLDIQMPNMSGVEIGKFIRNSLDDNTTQIIYISGESRYAMELFDIRPLNFIIKPFDEVQIENVLMTGVKLICNNRNLFEYKVRECIYRVEYSKIYYFACNSRKVEMVTKESKIDFYEGMDSLYERVKNNNFLHIHRSYIVNDAHIVQFKTNSVVMDNGEELPVSRSKKSKIRELWK